MPQGGGITLLKTTLFLLSLEPDSLLTNFHLDPTLLENPLENYCVEWWSGGLSKDKTGCLRWPPETQVRLNNHYLFFHPH